MPEASGLFEGALPHHRQQPIAGFADDCTFGLDGGNVDLQVVKKLLWAQQRQRMSMALGFSIPAVQ